VEKWWWKLKLLVTGGLGFIGSHLTQTLLKKGHSVVVLDNYSSGNLDNLRDSVDNGLLNIVKEDLKKPSKLCRIVKECDLIFHLAANPEVKLGATNPQLHFEENILTTFNLLEALRRSRKPRTVVFTSTSTVYGECSRIPTTEDYGPLIPISTYGASKLSCEALISSYAHTFNHRALIVRLANIIGPKSNHGVVVDFVKKILANPNELEILGDGYQEKSYLYVTDCIDAIMHLCEKFNEDTERVTIYNVGSADTVRVREIAEIVSMEMNVPDIKYKFTGGVDGGRGWKGDVKTMQLSIEKLRQTGWAPRYNSRQAVRLTVKALLGTNTK
jgi:UDP-glucose 4-epimerase